MTEKSFASIFVLNIPDIHLNRNGVVRHGRGNLSPLTLWKEAKQYALVPKLYAISPNAYLLESDVSLATRVYAEIRQSLEVKKKEEVEKEEDDDEMSFSLAQEQLFKTRFNESIKSFLSDLLFIELVDHEKKWIIHDEVQDVSYPYAYSVIDTTLRRLITNKKLYAEFLKQNIRQCRKIYSPHDPRFIDDEGGHVCYNSYNKPTWAKGWTPDPEVKALPEKTEFFFNHLSGGSQIDKEMLLSFARDTLFHRALYILILRGAAGCGKNMFVENLLANLVGCNSTSSNYHKTSRSFLESSFQGAITRHQLVFADEVSITETRSETLKDWHNAIGTGDDKYATAVGPVQLRCSIVCATNLKRNVTMKLGDRKYLVPTLNDVDIKRVTSQKWIDALIEEWKDPEILRQIASYLYANIEEQKQFDVKTPQFLELCWISNPEYLKKFIHLAVSQKTLREKEFRKYYRSSDRRGLSLDTLRDQFDEFVLGHRVPKGDGGTWTLDEKLEWVFESNLVGRTDLIIHSREGSKPLRSVVHSAPHSIEFQA